MRSFRHARMPSFRRALSPVGALAGSAVVGAMLFAWIALSFVSAVIGFFSLVIGRKHTLGIDPDGHLWEVMWNRQLELDPTRAVAG